MICGAASIIDMVVMRIMVYLNMERMKCTALNIY